MRRVSQIRKAAAGIAKPDHKVAISPTVRLRKNDFRLPPPDATTRMKRPKCPMKAMEHACVAEWQFQLIFHSGMFPEQQLQ